MAFYDPETQAKKDEAVRERIRLLRRAISLLCNNEPALINQAMAEAEKDIYGQAVDI